MLVRRKRFGVFFLLRGLDVAFLQVALVTFEIDPTQNRPINMMILFNQPVRTPRRKVFHATISPQDNLESNREQ
jgi:hypothetical protein